MAIVRGVPSSYFLMRFAEGRRFVTGTWHETSDEAFGRAEFEHEGVSGTWRAAAGAVS